MGTYTHTRCSFYTSLPPPSDSGYRTYPIIPAEHFIASSQTNAERFLLHRLSGMLQLCRNMATTDMPIQLPEERITYQTLARRVPLFTPFLWTCIRQFLQTLQVTQHNGLFRNRWWNLSINTHEPNITYLQLTEFRRIAQDDSIKIRLSCRHRQDCLNSWHVLVTCIKTVLFTNNTAVWTMILYSLVNVEWRFGGMYRLLF